MRVVQVITSPDGGGAERLVRELTQRLPEHGIESSAIYFCNPRGVELSPREVSLGLRAPRSLLAVPRLRRCLRELTGNGERVVLHSHLTWPLYYAALAGRGRNVAHVYTEHSTHNKRRERPWLRPLERWAYRRFERVVCISDGTKVALGDWLDDSALSARMTTIVNGSRMLPMIVRKKECGGACRLVSVGSLSPQKGFDVALRAVAQLGDRVASYTIVGEGPERDRLEAMVGDFGLQEKVRLPGYCNDVTPYFHEADLGVIPSRWEGFGLVAVEALSTGLPLVASDVPGLREVLSPCDAAILAKADDVAALREAIAYGLDNLAGNGAVSESARSRAEEFTIDAMVARYAELYKEVLDGGEKDAGQGEVDYSS